MKGCNLKTDKDKKNLALHTDKEKELSWKNSMIRENQLEQPDD